MTSKKASKPALSRRERGNADRRVALSLREKSYFRNRIRRHNRSADRGRGECSEGTLFLYITGKSELLLRLSCNGTAQELEPAIGRVKVSRKVLPGIRPFLRICMNCRCTQTKLFKCGGCSWHRFGQACVSLEQPS